MRIIDGLTFLEIKKTRRRQKKTLTKSKDLVPTAALIAIAILSVISILFPINSDITLESFLALFYAAGFWTFFGILGAAAAWMMKKRNTCWRELQKLLKMGQIRVEIGKNKITVKLPKNACITSIGYILIMKEQDNYAMRYIPQATTQTPWKKGTITIDNTVIVTKNAAIIPAIATKYCLLGIIPNTEGYYLKIEKDIVLKAGKYDVLTVSQRGRNIEVIYRFLKTSGYKLTFMPKIPYYITEDVVNWILSWVGKEINVHKNSTIPYIQLRVVPGKVRVTTVVVYPKLDEIPVPSPELLLKNVTEDNKPIIIGMGVLKITINVPNAPDKTTYVPAKYVKDSF